MLTAVSSDPRVVLSHQRAAYRGALSLPRERGEAAYRLMAVRESALHRIASRRIAPSLRRVAGALAAQGIGSDSVPALHRCGLTLDMIEAATDVPPILAVALIQSEAGLPC